VASREDLRRRASDDAHRVRVDSVERNRARKRAGARGSTLRLRPGGAVDQTRAMRASDAPEASLVHAPETPLLTVWLDVARVSHLEA